jgi:protoheme IX farnesyltransferase
MFTGMAGYMSARCPVFNIPTLSALTLTLFLSISGSTVLNMWYDRDIDARMQRTQAAIRPQRAPRVLLLGLALAVLGGGALALELRYGGFFANVL